MPKAASGIYRTFAVTFPRSGHHWLERMLKHYFEGKEHYCEMYLDPDHAIENCRDTNIQKTHDFDLSLVPNARRHYLVQIRNPESAIRSWYNLFASANQLGDETFDEFRTKRLGFWFRFAAKWTKDEWPTHIPRLVVWYEDIARDPVGTLARCVRFMDASGGKVDYRKIVESVEAHWRNKVIVQACYAEGI